MAQLISVKLSRFDGSPWGFRLQGGKDFGTPLVVQKVNGGSPAEAAGLRAGDAVIRVNSTDMFNLRHKDAQDVIVRAGNNFEVTVQRGGSTWKPSVTPLTSSLPSPVPAAPVGSINPVTKTSLAAKKQDVPLIGSGHNFSPKPFLNGTSDGPIKSIVNKQYNSPVGIYSEETIAETLSAQAEVLAGGVLGVNFKKNEKNYNAENSEVFKMVQEADKEPKTPEPAEPPAQSGVVTPSSPALAGLRPVSAPETKQPAAPSTPQTSLPPGQNICADCERLIVGVFVRIKDKNLHVECFKCSTCGTSLKNVGYYNINNKLYCDIHAKMVARQNAPSGMVPITVPPGGKAPAGTISAALSNITAPMSPPLSNHGSSPQPFSTCNRSSPDNGYRAVRGSAAPAFMSNGCLKNGQCNGESRTFTSTLTIQTGGGTEAPTSNNIIGPKPFGSSTPTTNLSSAPAFNAGSTTLTRPQSQTVTETYETSSYYELTEETQSTNPQPPRPETPSRSETPSQFSTSHTPSHFYQSQTPSRKSCCHRTESQYKHCQIETTSARSETPSHPSRSATPSNIHRSENTSDPPCPERTSHPSSVKSKSLAWPPPKPIEDITYPTASPLYIDPNPALERKSQQQVRERRAGIEACERALKQRSVSTDREDWCTYECRRRGEDAMDRVSCPGPVYKRVELVDTSSRQSRSETRSETVSRPSSTDSLRRSLTPTRIAQPVPKPWTATVTSGSNIYEQSYPISPPEHGPEQKLCKRYSHREVSQREKLCERGQTFREEERAYRSEIRRSEQLISPKPPLPPQPTGPKELRQEIDMKVIDLTSVDAKTSDISDIVPPDVSATITLTKKKEAGTVTESAEHDLVTEFTEEDVGDAHIVKSSTFEKTVEMRTPERSNTPVPVVEEVQEAVQESAGTSSREIEESMEETCHSARRQVTETVEKRYESKRMEMEEHKTVEESAEVVTSAIDTQQLMEKARQEEEERKREEEEEERRKEEEEKRRREEEERRAQEKWRKREEEERKKREEEEERSAKHVSFCEEQDYEETETVSERPLGRKVIREEHITTTDSDTPGREKITKEIYEEITEEVLVQERVKRIDIDEDDRRRSLREQVEVHQNLRESQVPKRFGESLETSKKHVQFMKQTESGPQPIPHSAIQNASPKEWKSEMVNALTTAPERPFTPLSKSSSVKEVYTEETIYLNRRGPRKEPRAISPFQKALMIAPERPYTPLGREIGDEDQHLSRSVTPSAQCPPEGYCPPADILYSDMKVPSQKVCKKKEGPRPLPTPPPDYRFRETSVSPVRSRPETPKERPSSRSLIAGLKKPDTIPSYQRNLVAMKKGPVEGRPYTPTSRTPTPTSGRTKSPSDGLQDAPVCQMKAPRIKEDAPSQEMSFTRFPGKKYVSYKVEEDTPDGHKSEEYTGAKSCEYTECRTCDGPAPCLEEHHSRVEERRYMKREEEKKEERVRRALEVTEEFESCEKQPVQAALEYVDECTIGKVSKTPPSLPCPVSQTGPGKEVNIPIQSSYKASSEVKHVKYDTAESSTCPETGLTVLPCKAISDQGSKVGVVVVPCEGPRATCMRSGVCVVPTSDRSGVCVSPCFDRQPGKCGQPSGSCGRESAGCEFDVRNCSDSGVCVMPNPDGSISVAPCGKPVKCARQGACGASPSANLPFPQIPLPYEEVCTKKSSYGCTTTTSTACSSSYGCTSSGGCATSTGCASGHGCGPDDCNFQPIHKPRTNLSGQLARLTAKRDIPTIQLYKPQAQGQGQCDRPGHCPPETNRPTQNHCQGQFQTPSSKTQRSVDPPNLSSHPDIGSGVGGLGGAGSKSGSFAGSSAPKRGRGILNQASGPGSRLPLCAHCNSYVRGPFITALGQIWCPEHFVCVNTQCRRPLQDIGFVEEKGQLYCEYCFERFIAPACNKCNNKIKGDCLNAIGKHFHPECFNCSYCGKLFGNSPFFLEEGLPYCEADWNELFTTKCFACGFPVEAGDRWVEALNNNYHSQCFNCTMCKKNLEGQSFYAKGGRPFCKNHAR